MQKTITEKIMSKYAGKSVVPGEIVTLPVHRLVFMDWKGPSIFRYLEEELGQSKPRYPERVVMVCDHLGLGHDLENAQIIEQFRQKAKEYGVGHFYGIGRSGIGHQLMVEDGLVSPGSITLGCDSHSTTYGALGAFSCGISSSETAAVLATGDLWFKVPASIRVVFHGTLPFGCYGKDVALKIISILKADQHALYRAVEFAGEGTKSLSMDDRIAICNMMAETGAKNCIFPVDDITEQYLAGRLQEPYEKVYSDENAAYAEEYHIDLDELVPMLAPPGRIDDARPVSEFDGIPLSHTFLGSCTSGRLEELGIAAELFRDRQISENVTMLVVPASQKIYIECAARGYLQTLSEAGAAVESSNCANCSGMHSGLLPDHAVCMSTANRNGSGRMGSFQASIYLASAATVAASSLDGCIRDPRELMKKRNIGRHMQ